MRDAEDKKKFGETNGSRLTHSSEIIIEQYQYKMREKGL
jgi:hypothetical protein